MVTRERVCVPACRVPVPVACAGLGVRVDEENVALAFVQSPGENPGKRYFSAAPPPPPPLGSQQRSPAWHGALQLWIYSYECMHYYADAQMIIWTSCMADTTNVICLRRKLQQVVEDKSSASAGICAAVSRPVLA